MAKIRQLLPRTTHRPRDNRPARQSLPMQVVGHELAIKIKPKLLAHVVAVWDAYAKRVPFISRPNTFKLMPQVVAKFRAELSDHRGLRPVTGKYAGWDCLNNFCFAMGPIAALRGQADQQLSALGAQLTETLGRYLANLPADRGSDDDNADASPDELASEAQRLRSEEW